MWRSQWLKTSILSRDMKCCPIVHDLEVMGLHTGWVELGVCSRPTFVQFIPEP